MNPNGNKKSENETNVALCSDGNDSGGKVAERETTPETSATIGVGERKATKEEFDEFLGSLSTVELGAILLGDDNKLDEEMATMPGPWTKEHNLISEGESKRESELLEKIETLELQVCRQKSSIAELTAENERLKNAFSLLSKENDDYVEERSDLEAKLTLATDALENLLKSEVVASAEFYTYSDVLIARETLAKLKPRGEG